MRITLLGCSVDNLSMEETLQCIGGFIRSGKPHQHVVINVDKLIKVHRDPNLRKIIEQCDLINVDSQPIMWASRLLGQPLKARITGIDLMEELMKLAAQRGYRPYFLGARASVVERVVRHYQEHYPTLSIAGYRDGYWDPCEEERMVQAIKEVRPDILFVAISSPKKEIFIRKYLYTIGVPFVMGVGGSFDVIAGVTSRAPHWVQHAGLEWFWRFLQEPRRMWKRYFVDDIVFVKLVLRELLKRGRYESRH